MELYFIIFERNIINIINAYIQMNFFTKYFSRTTPKKKLLIASFNETTLETLSIKTKISAKDLPINLMRLLLNELNRFTNLNNLEIMESMETESIQYKDLYFAYINNYKRIILYMTK
jgi:hypothetical protein